MTWWKILLLVFAAFRLTRLVGWDDLTIKPRRWLTGMGDSEHHAWAEWIDEMAEKGLDAFDPRTEAGMKVPPVSERRFYLSRMIRCPWCVGFWISGMVVAVGWRPWSWWMIAAWFAVSALVGLIAKNLDE